MENLKPYKLFGGPLDGQEVFLEKGAETYWPTPAKFEAPICYDRKTFINGGSTWAAFVLRDNEEQDNKEAYEKAARYFDALCQLGKPAKLYEYHPVCAECAYHFHTLGDTEYCGIRPEGLVRRGETPSCKEFKLKINT